MKFKNWLQTLKHDSIYNNPGKRVVDVKQLVIDDDGNKSLKVVGKRDLWSEIQSHKDSVDIHVIMQRYKNGDLGVLDKMSGAFIDVTDFPKNYAEMLQSMIDARNAFDGLSQDRKDKFGSFEHFLESFGTEKWFSVFGLNFDEDDKELESSESGKDVDVNE